MALIGEMQYLTIGGNTYSLPSGGGGSVTSVAVSNATNGGLSVSGSPISSSGTITIGHSNVLSSAQTTQAVYPIKIDKNGHISAYGTAVTIPTVNNATLTIQKNGTTVNSFTANASSNVTANITVPTKVSELTNDSGFITSYTDTKNTAGSTDTSSKIYLIGATSQAANPQTYSHDTAYVGTAGYLYSNSNKVLVEKYGTDSTGIVITPYVSEYGSNFSIYCNRNDNTNNVHQAMQLNVSDDNVNIADVGDERAFITVYARGSYPNGNVFITGLPTPTQNDMAANKKYVDDSINALDATITGTAGAGKTLTAFSQTDGKVTATFGNISITKSQISDFPTIPDVSGKIDTAGTGLSKSGTTLNHSNSVTAQTTQAVYPIKIDAQGHISAYGSAVTIPTNTDEKLKVAEINSNTQYYPIVGTGTTAATRQYDTNGFLYKGITGTTSSVGLATIALGNSTASGAANNKKGQIQLYGPDDNYLLLEYAGTSNNRTITFPDKAGTVALTSDIPSVSYPVTSVNNKTGAVSLTASDVGALASSTTYVSTVTTTAGAHTAISSKSGAVSFNVPTTAAHVGAATSDHTHGNITNGGDITATAPTIASGDQIIINDDSASKVTNGPTFDGSTTTKALSQKGTWETFSNSLLYGECSTAAGTVAKTVTVSSSFKLETGATIAVKFSNANTATTPTLNVNDTGAKLIKRYGTTAVTSYDYTSWKAGEVVPLLYDGTYWLIMNNMAQNNQVSMQTTSTNSYYNTLITNKTSTATGVVYFNNGHHQINPNTGDTLQSGRATTADLSSSDIDTFVNSLNYSQINAVDYIVEQGTSGSWHYRKWNSGIAECWLQYNPGSYTCGTARGSLYSGGNLTLTYPITFIWYPTVTGNVSLGTDAYVVWLQFNGLGTTTAQCRIVGNASIAANSNYLISVYAIGEWK